MRFVCQQNEKGPDELSRPLGAFQQHGLANGNFDVVLHFSTDAILSVAADGL